MTAIAATLVIILMLLSSKLSSMFIKKMKNKLSPETLKKYRFWIAEFGMFIFVFGSFVGFVVGGVVNSEPTDSFRSALILCSASFVFYTVVILVVSLFKKNKS